MTIGDDIAEWAKSRPQWQQQILQTLADGRPVGEPELSSAIDALLGTTEAAATKTLDLAIASVDDATVTLSAIRNSKGVNALVDDQELEFAEHGMTVVYGDNGSGKSGYARLIKDAVGARHATQVLPDVFEDRADEPAATVHFSADGDSRDHKTPGPPDPLVRQMHFYDEHCGDVYVTRKSVITYRPSALALLDGLIEVCDRLRNAVSDRLRENSSRALELGLPTGTEAATFVSSLTADTLEAAIDAAVVPDPDTTQKRADALGEVARLEGSNAATERTRLAGLSQAASSLSALLVAAGTALGSEALDRARSELAAALRLRQIATVAATADFDQELPGVGSETWRALWAAARAYSTTEAYHDQTFPVTQDAARCPLCHQQLDESGRDRLQRFDQYMRDTTERDAAAAEQVVRVRSQTLRQLTVGNGAGTGHLNTLHQAFPDLATLAQAALVRAGATRDRVSEWLEGTSERPEPLSVDEELTALDSCAPRMSAEAAAIDVEAFATNLANARASVRELESHLKLRDSRDALRDEVARLKERRMLEGAQGQVSTTAITSKSTQLTKLYAGEVIKDFFVRETERLRLRRVTIRDLGGTKGQLEQQPGLLGAKAGGVQAVEVLSEGEQTAMGLAGFFTEAAFDASRSALILDDPVTSLDHVRRKYVAHRLAELSRDRQVVVFTHDVTFAGELQKQAANLEVSLTTRSIERKGEVPGFVRNALPWKAKDFGARLSQVEQELARLTKERAQFGQDDWDKAVGSWAGDLSELWESCVNSEILDEVFDRGTAEVRVMKFRILAAVTQGDDSDFQAGYGACSTWARRHNKAQETNYVPPEPDEMKAEVDRIREWQKRVKKYRS